MKAIKYTLSALAIAAAAVTLTAQDNNDRSTGSIVRRRTHDAQTTTAATGVTERMQSLYGESSEISDADIQWLRIIYRQLDLTKVQNAPLYFPEEPEEGQENLFRIIMRLLADNKLTAYEYLDGREIFTDKYKVPVKDILDRFHIIYTSARGSNERNPRYVIDESDVPTNEVLSYYIIERWTFDTRNNRLRPEVDAICPVLHRAGDFGGEAVRYPMFWVKMSDLRPSLALQQIFVNDDNNLPTSTYDDYFTLTMYDGEIYKTRNLRNQSLAQQFPDAEDLKHAQDSIQTRLNNFENNLWTPTREELQARAQAQAEAAAAGDSTAAQPAKAPQQQTQRSTRRSSRRQSSHIKESSQQRSQSATRSVRRRK